jgi:hypothetical protein
MNRSFSLFQGDAWRHGDSAQSPPVASGRILHQATPERSLK